MKILLTGAKGQLGSCFIERSKNWDVIATDYEELDITNLAEVISFSESHKPDFIVNAAAYTAVDKAEEDADTCYQVNAIGSRNLATAAKNLGVPLLHVSTDYVFNGESEKPYLPTDVVSPLGVYGQTKWEGEEFVREIQPEHVILRTAWVFSEFGGNFVKTMLRVGAQREELGVVADQKGCPTYAGHLADALVKIIEEITALENSADYSLYGTHHFCGSEETTWHGFAEAIFDQALECKTLEKRPKVNAIGTKDYPTPAKRPAYSVMDCASVEGLGVNRNWREALAEVLAKL